MNTSATGGYLQPAPQFPVLSGTLTFSQFIQSVLVGISGIDDKLVRPKWQKNPPKQPDIDVNWIAFGLVNSLGDANAFVGSTLDGMGNTINITQRMEELELQCSFYGPSSQEYAALVRDGFQIPSNLVALTVAKMGFKETTQAHRVPDLVNERWVDRYEMSVFLRREILRAYPILTFVSMSGTIEAMLGSHLKTLNWNAKV